MLFHHQSVSEAWMSLGKWLSTVYFINSNNAPVDAVHARSIMARTRSAFVDVGLAIPTRVTWKIISRLFSSLSSNGVDKRQLAKAKHLVSGTRILKYASFNQPPLAAPRKTAAIVHWSITGHNTSTLTGQATVRWTANRWSHTQKDICC